MIKFLHLKIKAKLRRQRCIRKINYSKYTTHGYKLKCKIEIKMFFPCEPLPKCTLVSNIFYALNNRRLSNYLKLKKRNCKHTKLLQGRENE